MAKRSHEFIGRRYSPEEGRQQQKYLRDRERDGAMPVEGELEKTEMEKLLIDTANELVAKAQEDIDISASKPIMYEQVHVLSGEEFEKRQKEGAGPAFYDAITNDVYINRDANYTTAYKLSVLVHEMIHRASKRKFHASSDYRISSARLGYRLHSAWKETKKQTRLVGLNEILTVRLQFKILNENAALLEKRFGVSPEELRGPIYGYQAYGPILSRIVSKIVERTGKNTYDVLTSLERGMFENNLLVLKDIEQSCGKGSLEVLSVLGSYEGEFGARIDALVAEYFQSSNDDERTAIGNTLNTTIDEAGAQPD